MRACPFRSAPTRDSRSADPVPVSAGARFPDKFATPPALRPGVSVFRGGIRGGCGAGSEQAFRPGGRPAFSGGFCPERLAGPARRTAPFPGSLVRTGGRTGCSGPMAFAETVVWNRGRGPLRPVVRGWSSLPGCCPETAWK